MTSSRKPRHDFLESIFSTSSKLLLYNLFSNITFIIISSQVILKIKVHNTHPNNINFQFQFSETKFHV